MNDTDDIDHAVLRHAKDDGMFWISDATRRFRHAIAAVGNSVDTDFDTGQSPPVDQGLVAIAGDILHRRNDKGGISRPSDISEPFFAPVQDSSDLGLCRNGETVFNHVGCR